MPGLKRKSIASEPGSSSKPVKKQKRSSSPTKPFKSSEYVVDSSENEEAVPARSVAKATKSTSERMRPSLPSIADKELKSIEARPKVASSPLNASKKQKHQASVHSSTTSETDSSHESDDGERYKATARGETDQEVAKAGNSSGDDSESAGNSEETSHDISDDEASPAAAEPVQNPSEPPDPPFPYNPPPGFEMAIIKPSTKVQDLFAKENLNGKQIWYITAPVSVSITSIKEVPVEKVATGTSILSIKDADYGLIQENEPDGEAQALLIPFPEKNDYRIPKVKISQTLHFRQIVKLPGRPEAPVNGATNVSKSHIKVVRQQPEGLRMRYRPFGDDSSSEDSENAPQFKMPPVLAPAKISKEPMPAEGEDKPSSTKDYKKPKKIAKSAPINPDSSNTPTAASKPTSKKYKAELANGTSSISAPPGDPPDNETLEEKAQRRAEKKRRKERRASDSKEHGEVEEARKILASSKHAKENIMPTTIKGNAVEQNPQEPEKIKPKKKKRKSEPTEDV
ncbi:MAG: hypothetical protein Q9170_006604 [Blastenia crenularia]